MRAQSSAESDSFQPNGLCSLPGFSWQDTRKTSHFLLQGIFLTQGSNPRLLSVLHWDQVLYHCASWEAQNNAGK